MEQVHPIAAQWADPERCELIDGELVYKVSPGWKHGFLQSKLSGMLDPFNRLSKGDKPGGWLIATEVEIQFAPSQRYLPDLAGWRLQRAGQLVDSDEHPVTVIPDWVCEILSDSTAYRDVGVKQRTYHQSHVGHYWLLDPQRKALHIMRRAEEGYVIVDVATIDRSTVLGEPFVDGELDMRALFALLAQ